MEQTLESNNTGRYIAERLWCNGEYPDDYYDAVEAQAHALVAEHGATPAVGRKVYALTFGNFHGENLWDDLGGKPSDFCHDPSIPFGNDTLPEWCASVETCNEMQREAGERVLPNFFHKLPDGPDGDEPDETAEEAEARRYAEAKARGPEAYRQWLADRIDRANYNKQIGLLDGNEDWQVAARARLDADVQEWNTL